MHVHVHVMAPGGLFSRAHGRFCLDDYAGSHCNDGERDCVCVRECVVCGRAYVGEQDGSRENIKEQNEMYVCVAERLQ